MVTECKDTGEEDSWSVWNAVKGTGSEINQGNWKAPTHDLNGKSGKCAKNSGLVSLILEYAHFEFCQEGQRFEFEVEAVSRVFWNKSIVGTL